MSKPKGYKVFDGYIADNFYFLSLDSKDHIMKVDISDGKTCKSLNYRLVINDDDAK